MTNRRRCYTTTSVFASSSSNYSTAKMNNVHRFCAFTNPCGVMKMFLVVVLFLAAPIDRGSCAAHEPLPDLSTIPTPPYFIHEPNPSELFFFTSSGQSNPAGGGNSLWLEKRIKCVAGGLPRPRCHWTFNGTIISADASNGTIVPEGVDGTIVINNLGKESVGTYQCRCSNQNGTAVDQPVDIKEAHSAYFPSSEAVETIEVKAGDPLTQECPIPASSTRARVLWISMLPGVLVEHLNSFNKSYIISNDVTGQLFILYVHENMLPAGHVFTCVFQSQIVNDLRFGKRFRIKLKEGQKTLPSFVPPQELYTSPTTVLALRGQSFTLWCVFGGVPELTPHWNKVDGDVAWNRATFGTTFNKSLKIEKVEPGDAGFYECNVPDTSTRKRFQVNVEAAPYWISDKPPSNVNTSEGETAFLECNVDGHPRPTVTFFQNGKPFEPVSDRIVFESAHNRIRIERARVTDIAAYQCLAENKHGKLWASFYINILAFRPYLENSSGRTLATAGQKAELMCDFFAAPLPDVTWSVYEPNRTDAGTSITTLMGEQVNKTVDKNGIARLAITKVAKNMENSYQCYAKNKHGDKSAVVTLEVRDKTQMIQPPDGSQIKLAGETLILPCKAVADNRAVLTYAWSFQGPTSLEQKPLLKVTEDKTLKIDLVNRDDSGTYTCTASTELDNVTQRIHVIVEDVPIPVRDVTLTCEPDARNAALTFFHYGRAEIKTNAEEFICQYNDDKESTDFWEDAPGPVKISNNQKLGNCQIGLYAFGSFRFRVIARNGIGDSIPVLAMNDTQVATCVTPAAPPPSNPEGVMVKGTASDKVTVYWNPMLRRDWHGERFKYVIQYRPKNSDEAYKQIEVNDPHRSYETFDADEPDKEYEVLVRARNEKGDAEAAPALNYGKSTQEAPRHKVSNFNHMEGYPKSDKPFLCGFTWGEYAPADFKGWIDGYKIVRWHGSRKRAEPVEQFARFSNKSNSGFVYNMKPNVKNYVQILAFNNGGDGPRTDAMEISMPPGPPSQVQELDIFPTSHDQIGIIWQQPRELYGNLKGYNVTVCRRIPSSDPADQKLGNCDVQSVSAADKWVSHRINKLHPESEYRVTVAGETEGGLGEENSNYVKTLPSTVQNVEPEKPRILDRATEIGEDHFNITFRTGNYTNAPVGKDQVVMYRLADAPENSNWDEIEPANGSFTVRIPNLQPGTTYKVKVRTKHWDEDNKRTLTRESDPITLKTAGEPSSAATLGWLIAIFVAIIILLTILIIVCFVVRNRGAKYPVSEKEKEQGREPMLKEEKGFGEYARPNIDEEKRSLTAESKHESETDSMAEYGDGETGRFTEDGSFIGQYGAPNKVITGPASTADRGRVNLSTFV